MCIKVRCQSVRDSEEVALPISPQSGSCRAWRLADLDFDGMDMRMPEIQDKLPPYVGCRVLCTSESSEQLPKSQRLQYDVY